MTPGLVHGRAFVTCATRPTVQLGLLDDTSELASIQRQLRESEAAYDGLAEDYQELQTENGRLRRRILDLERLQAEMRQRTVPRAVLNVLVRSVTEVRTT